MIEKLHSLAKQANAAISQIQTEVIFGLDGIAAEDLTKLNSARIKLERGISEIFNVIDKLSPPTNEKEEKMANYLLINEDGSINKIDEITESHKIASLYGVLTIIDISGSEPKIHEIDDEWEHINVLPGEKE